MYFRAGARSQTSARLLFFPDPAVAAKGGSGRQICTLGRTSTSSRSEFISACGLIAATRFRPPSDSGATIVDCGTPLRGRSPAAVDPEEMTRVTIFPRFRS